MIPHVEATTLTTAKKVPIPKRSGSAALVHRLLLSKLLRIGVLLSICIIVPVTIYLIVFSRALGPLESFPVPSGTCSHLNKYRIRCGENLSRGLCVGRGCCYSTDYGCYHFMPSKSQFVHHATPELDSHERQQTKMSGRALYSLIPMSATSAHGFSMVPNLFCEINEISPNRLTIMVFNAPVATSQSAATLRPASDHTSSIMYYYEVSSPVFYISVYREEDRKLLLSTHRGAFVVTLNYIEWSFYLGTDVLIGLGSLRLTPGSRTIVATANYPNIPFIVAYDLENQKYHGLYLSSPYPIEVEVTEACLIVLRGIYDNESFSVELLVADDLDSLQLELHKIIGLSDPGAATYDNALQYGFHICDSESLFGGDDSQIEEDLKRYLTPEVLGDIPYDSHCLTERVAALNKNMPKEYLPFIDRFKSAGKAVILNLVMRLRCTAGDVDDNALTTPLERCDAMSNYDVLLRTSATSANTPYVTRIGEKEYVYVDWASQSIMLSLDVLLNETIYILNLGFDGIVLQGNWLQDDQLSNDPNPASDLFPYVPKDFLQIANGLVPPWESQSRPDNGPSGVETIRTYNAYAGQSVRWVSEYLRKQNQQGGGSDMFLSSESSPYPHTNTILRGISGTWAALNATRSEILSNSLTGLHSINSNICGDEVFSNYSAAARFDQVLCVRWYQFASMTSIFRALTTVFPHNFSKFNRKLLVRTIHARYSLSTYFLTMRRIRPSRAINTPLFYDYPGLHNDEAASNWMTVGLSLLAAPVITPTQHTLEVRLPEMSFEFNDGIRVPRNSSAVLSVILSDLPLFIKAGHIVAVNFVETSKTVIEARQEDLILVIALLPLTPEATAGDGNTEFRSSAQGWLAIDDDRVIEIIAAQNGTQATVSSRNTAPGIVNGCSGKTTNVSWSVRMIKWFGLWVDVVEVASSTPEVKGEVGDDSYRSLLCHLKRSVDLCTEELSISIDTASLTDIMNCTCTYL